MDLIEFLVWEEQQPERHEFFRGEIFEMVGGTARHNRVVLNLASRIGDHLDGNACQVFAGNMRVQIAEGVLYPDVMVTCGKAEAGDEQTVTDPKLIIEVLCPMTGGYDKRDKFILYRTLAALREYVLIDPTKRQLEVFTLTDGGSWLLTDQTNSVDLSLSCIDYKLPMELVFKGVGSDPACQLIPQTLESDGREARAEVTVIATRVLGTSELAEHWLTHPALALDGRRPLDLLTTAAGIQAVKDLLTRMEFGVYQ